MKRMVTTSMYIVHVSSLSRPDPVSSFDSVPQTFNFQDPSGVWDDVIGTYHLAEALCLSRFATKHRPMWQEWF